MGVGRWLDADVVVDVANLAYRIARALKQPGGGREPSLVLLVHALERCGIEIRSLTVVVPTRPFVGIGRTIEDLRDPAAEGDDHGVREQVQRRLDLTQLWIEDEREALAAEHLVAPRVVSGALAGARRGAERSVDELVTLTALDLLWDITPEEATPRPARPQRAVVVISEDDDVAAASVVASGRPLFLLGFDREVERRPREQNRRRRPRRRRSPHWITLPPAVLSELAAPSLRQRGARKGRRRTTADSRAALDELLGALVLGPRATAPDEPVRLWNDDGRGSAVSSALPDGTPVFAPEGSWEQTHRDVAEGAGTVAVIDDYGLLRSGCRVHGVAFLPDPGDVTEILQQHLLLPGEIARFAVLPDLERQSLPSPLNGRAGAGDATERDHIEALTRRDEEFDDSAERHSTDRRGAVQRSILKLVRRGATAAPDHGRPLAERYRLEEKRTVTLLAANVLWAMRHTTAQVVLLSDRAVLADVLERLPEVPADPERRARLSRALSDRVTRVGLHADPWRAEGLIVSDAPPPQRQQRPAGGPREGRLRGSLDDLLAEDGPLAHLVLTDRGVGTPHVVLLDGVLSERLVGLKAPADGTDRLVRLHRAVSDGRTVIEVVGHDPEEEGLRLRLLDADSADTEQSLETTLAGVLAVDPDVLEAVRGAGTIDELRQHYRVVLRGTREFPCAMPLLRDGEDDEVPSLVRAHIVRRSATGFTLDIDGDPDTTHDQHTVPVPHGFTTYRGASIEVVAADVDRDGRPDQLLGPTAGAADVVDASSGLPVVATVITHDRVRLDGPDGTGSRDVELIGAPRARTMTARPEERVLVVPVSSTQCYAMSSPLPHLQRGGGGTPAQ